jgi:hypothetical protein
MSNNSLSSSIQRRLTSGGFLPKSLRHEGEYEANVVAARASGNSSRSCAAVQPLKTSLESAFSELGL